MLKLSSYSFSGKLLYQNMPCDRCEVSLENFGVPVGTVFSDSVGNFVFSNLRPGIYTLRVNVEGFESVEQRVEVSQFFGGQTIVTLTPKSANGENSESDHVIHVSSYLKRYPEKAVDLFKKAHKNVRKGKSKEAVTQLEEAIGIAPDFYNAHNYLGLLYKADQRFEDAEKEFEIAQSLNETSPEPLINLSGLYIDGNQPDRAVEAGEKAVKRDARSAPAFFNLGLALYRASKFLRAQEALQRALDLAPKMVQVRLALANVFMKMGNVVGFREQLKLYIRENPKAKDRAEVERVLSELSAQEEPAK